VVSIAAAGGTILTREGKGHRLRGRYVPKLDPTSKRVKLLTIVGGFYGFISVNVSVWLNPCFSGRVTEPLTVTGPPPKSFGG
jgi:hypothetical protein